MALKRCERPLRPRGPRPRAPLREHHSHHRSPRRPSAAICPIYRFGDSALCYLGEGETSAADWAWQHKTQIAIQVGLTAAFIAFPELIGADVVAEEGMTIASSEGGAILPYTEIRSVAADETNEEELFNELKARMWESGGNEHALVRYPNGERAIGSGGPGGISDIPGEVLAHVHPTAAGPSDADIAAAASQRSGMYVLHGGEITYIPGGGG